MNKALIAILLLVFGITAHAEPDKLIFGVLESYLSNTNAVATNDCHTVKVKFKAVTGSDRVSMKDTTQAFYQGKPANPNIPIRFFDLDILRRRSVLPALNVNPTNLVNWMDANVSATNQFFWAWYDSDLTGGWDVLATMQITPEEQ